MILLRKRLATSLASLVLLAVSANGAPAQDLAGQSREAADQIRNPEGQRIVNIVFEPERQPLEGSALFEILPVRRNESYHASDVRAAIARLYATGRYRDIQVDVSAADGGVLVRFLTEGNWFVGAVEVRGELSEPPNRGQIVDASRLQLGEPFDMSAMAPAIAAITRLFTDNGFYRPRIEPEYKYDSAYQQVSVTFVIHEGRRDRYDAPEITGNTEVLTKQEIIKTSGWRRFLLPGYKGITESRTRSAIDHIRIRYRNANRILATVVLTSLQPEQKTNLARPVIAVNPGPPVKINAPGARLSRKALQDTIPAFQEGAIDADLLSEGADDLKDYFQAHGYFDAKVTLKGPRQDDRAIEIDYYVDRGIRHQLTDVSISGNSYFDAKTLRERMLVTPKSFEFRDGRYGAALLQRDVDVIKELYESNGFRDVQVASKVVDDYGGRKGALAVFLTIVEGPQYLVRSLEIKGVEKLDLKAITGSLSSQPGQPFSEFNVASDRETIIGRYGENGFDHATFEWTSKPGPQPHTIDLQFFIDEGEQQFVREVAISGLHATRPKLVYKQLELNPGSPLSAPAMADTQRRLDNLGIFAQVNMAVQNPEGDERRKYVLYDLTEASRYSLTVAGGLEFARIGGSNAAANLSEPGGAPGVTPRLSVDLTRLNFMGLGQSISLQGRISTLQRRALANYHIPRIFSNPRLDGTFSILYDDTHEVRTFVSKREEVSGQIADRVSKAITLFYRFTYRRSGVSELKIDPLLVPLLAQSVRVGIGEFNLVQDRRDDPLDPHTGIYNTLDLGLATKAFGSQATFGRLLARNATYYRLGRKFVLARQTQFGVEPAFAVQPDSDPTDPIPLAERFFGGGGNSMRGFPEDQAGPRDLLTGFPLGGSALFFNNVELRFPLFGPDVGGVLFEDAGNIYSRLSRISFRFDQQNPSDFNYMVQALGFGVRYRTPIGPIRLDLAWSINPPRFSGFPGNYNQLVACSEANKCQASPQQISHFQFFLSIGQAF